MKASSTRPQRPRQSRIRKARAERLIERLATERVEALGKAVDFSPIAGAPEWVVRLVLPDASPLLGKHPSRWRPEEVARLQESIDSLPPMFLSVLRTEFIVI